MIVRALREGVDGELKLPVFKRLSFYRDLPNADVRCRYVRVRGDSFDGGESVGRSKWRVCIIEDNGGTSGQAESYCRANAKQDGPQSHRLTEHSGVIDRLDRWLAAYR